MWLTPGSTMPAPKTGTTVKHYWYVGCRHVTCSSLASLKVTHTYTDRFNGRIPGSPGLAGSTLILCQSPLILILSVLAGQSKTLRIPSDTIPPDVPFVYRSFTVHQRTSLDPVCIILAFNMSKPPFLIAKLTGSIHSSSLSSIFLCLRST